MLAARNNPKEKEMKKKCSFFAAGMETNDDAAGSWNYYCY